MQRTKDEKDDADAQKTTTESPVCPPGSLVEGPHGNVWLVEDDGRLARRRDGRRIFAELIRKREGVMWYRGGSVSRWVRVERGLSRACWSCTYVDGLETEVHRPDTGLISAATARVAELSAELDALAELAEPRQRAGDLLLLAERVRLMATAAETVLRCELAEHTTDRSTGRPAAGPPGECSPDAESSGAAPLAELAEREAELVAVLAYLRDLEVTGAGCMGDTLLRIIEDGLRKGRHRDLHFGDGQALAELAEGECSPDAEPSRARCLSVHGGSQCTRIAGHRGQCVSWRGDRWGIPERTRPPGATPGAGECSPSASRRERGHCSTCGREAPLAVELDPLIGPQWQCARCIVFGGAS